MTKEQIITMIKIFNKTAISKTKEEYLKNLQLANDYFIVYICPSNEDETQIVDDLRYVLNILNQKTDEAIFKAKHEILDLVKYMR